MVDEWVVVGGWVGGWVGGCGYRSYMCLLYMPKIWGGFKQNPNELRYPSEYPVCYSHPWIYQTKSYTAD